MDWKEISAAIQWEDAMPLQEHCEWKVQRVLDNSCIGVVNVFALNKETF